VVAYLPHLVLMLGVLTVVPGAPETVARGGAGAITRALPSLRQPRFYRVVAPMAPWVFAAPAVAFALLPSVVGAAHATDGIALTAVVTMATAMAGVFIQPVARRLDAHAGNRAATLGLTVIVAGLVLAAVTAHAQETWLLIPTSIVLGTGYGLCLVAGLVEVQRLAAPEGLAGLTALYYVLTYIGFAVPYLLALAAHLTGYTTLLLITAGLALFTAVWVSLQRRPATG
jgi:hypothetical protein